MSTGTAMPPPLALGDVRAAAGRIAELAERTPVLTCPVLDRACGHRVFLKCETMQRTGSFKYRGAANAVLSLSEEDARKGVACHSSGNHGAAVAAAARELGVPAVVVVPRDTAAVKLRNIERYGARVVFCDPGTAARAAACRQEAAKMGGAAVIHPYGDAAVIAGQGTIALELMEQVENLDAIIVPVSGGGMLSGVAVAARGLRPDGSCKVFAVEPLGKELGRCLEVGQREPDASKAGVPLETVCDAMPTRAVGELPWQLIHSFGLVDRHVLSVSDEQVVSAMRFAFEEAKLVVEPAAAAGLAALLSNQLPLIDNCPLRVGVVLCGGNVDVRAPLPWQVPSADGLSDDEKPPAKKPRA